MGDFEPNMMTKKAWALAILFIVGLTGCATMQGTVGVAPLPNDTNIIPPSPDLPKNIAGFSGKWVGNWIHRTGNNQEIILVVEEVWDKSARILYSWGVNPNAIHSSAGYFRQTSQITSDTKPKIHVIFRHSGLNAIIFELEDSNTLVGSIESWSGFVTAKVILKKAN